MKKILILYSLLVINQFTSSQNLYDQYYMMGQVTALVSFSIPDTAVISYPVPWKLGCDRTLAFVCNKNGIPEFYTNGTQIGNIYGDTLLASGMQENGVAQDYRYGMPIPQGAIILPKNDCQYYCVYFSVSDSLYQFYQQPDLLYYALVDMCANTGRGAVLSIKNLLYHGLMGDSRMTACKHANGRDWWLVVHGWNNNNYIKFLITPDSISGPFMQQIGPAELEPDILGQAVFSLDGSKYASITGYSPLVILDFDRCSGQFSNPLSLNVSFFPPYQITGSGALGCAFSPSGRFLYVNEYHQIVQFDLLSDSIQNSMTKIAEYDTTYENPEPFESEYLAPNGKIYIQNWDGSPKCFHVINSPDSLGAGCNFQKGGLCLDYFGAYPISNMPHYRLGALVGSGCDTLRTGIENDIPDEMHVTIQPNPANEFAVIAYRFKEDENGNYIITDITGKTIFSGHLSANRDKSNLDLHSLSSGMYLISVHSDSGFKKIERLVIAR